MRRQQNERMSLAWHTAWLHRVDAKSFPRLKQLLSGHIKQPAEQSWQNQYAAVAAWVSSKGK